MGFVKRHRMNSFLKSHFGFYCIFLIGLVLFCFSCKESSLENSNSHDTAAKQEISFEEVKWKMKENLDYPYRNRMLQDLMTNRAFRMYNKNELLTLLGDANRVDSNYFFYTIAQKRIGLWPLHTKTLVIKFSEGDSVQWMKVHE